VLAQKAKIKSGLLLHNKFLIFIYGTLRHLILWKP